MEERMLTMRVEGEAITQIAREQCYYSRKFDSAMNILIASLQNEELEEGEIAGIALSILDGRAEIKGTYPDGDYRLEYLEVQDEKWKLGNLIDKIVRYFWTCTEAFHFVFPVFDHYFVDLSESADQSSPKAHEKPFFTFENPHSVWVLYDCDHFFKFHAVIPSPRILAISSSRSTPAYSASFPSVMLYVHFEDIFSAVPIGRTRSCIPILTNCCDTCSTAAAS